jgi:bifunctional non-homologous end joining protein LigD
MPSISKPENTTAEDTAKPKNVVVDGHRITLTNLDKVLYPSTGTTKRDVLAYYAEIASVLIPHAANRPVTRKRWPNGVGTAAEPGMMFFQKNLDQSTPKWVKRRSIEHSDHANEYPLVNDEATLIWLAQIAALEIHVPQWQFGRTGTRRNPDRLVLDLDPGEGAGLTECVEVAKLVRSILGDMGLEAMPVTSGSKGIHLYAALDGQQTSDQVSAVAHELARALEADHPDLVVSDMKKALRGGKVLVDWSQNNANKTTITPYSLRGRLEPTVAAPRTWRELSASDLTQLDYREVLRRVKRRGDPLAGLVSGHLESLQPTAERMHGFIPSASAADRLAKYRSMRDANKTPEPVPDSHDPSVTGRSFVIQEHQARRLHYDFRLEHDGVLVSWAVPKGVPVDWQKNHLAVQTEDHPLEYGSFEGIIPAGEYGAGEVSIWDSGEYDLEKWRDGEEVIVTLHGQDDGGLGGQRRVALIHTGGEGKADQNWIIHLMKSAAPAEARRTTLTPRPSKREDKPADPAPLPARFIAPMLASPGGASKINDGPEWAFEMKWDGIRAIATVNETTVTLTSRKNNDLTLTYPELLDIGEALDAKSAVVDGEIVALDGSGRPDFGRLQTRMNLSRPGDVERARKIAPVQFMAFDLLEVDGRSLLDKSYDERRAELERIYSSAPGTRVHFPPAIFGDLEHAIQTSKELKLEGIVAKRRSGRYEPGKRGSSWIKIKHRRTQEVLVGGWSPGQGRRANGIGAILVGIPEDGAVRYVGKVGTGFSDRLLDEMLRVLEQNERSSPTLDGVPASESRGARWVAPTLVGEVEFAEWTATGRLRQPSWRGWRPDKSPTDVRVE